MITELAIGTGLGKLRNPDTIAKMNLIKLNYFNQPV
jgi:hypothetical protein